MKQPKLEEVLRKHKLWLENSDGGERANLRNANLLHANLTDANLRNANLLHANLIHANLTDADLRSADLRNADLTGANLAGADLTDANLRCANLAGANLCCANLTGANLTDANLSCADLTGANLCWAEIPQIIIAGPAGRNNRITYFNFNADEVQMVYGRFRGTLAEFAVKVEEMHTDNPVHLAECRAMVKFFEAVKEARA